MKTGEPVGTKSEDEFVHSRIFDAPRDLVWKAFTDPEHMKHWWGRKGMQQGWTGTLDRLATYLATNQTAF